MNENGEELDISKGLKNKKYKVDDLSIGLKSISTDMDTRGNLEYIERFVESLANLYFNVSKRKSTLLS